MPSLFLKSLPIEQQMIWSAFAKADLSAFTLYGGTALALRYGHRISVDFDFFSDAAVNADAMAQRIPWLSASLEMVQQNHRNSYVVLARAPGLEEGGPVKLSFFGNISLPLLAEPLRAPNGVAIASVQDLLATKLKALHDRIEPKDYIDIAEILQRSAEPVSTLQRGLADFESVFAEANAHIALKTLCWFQSPELIDLSDHVRVFLRQVVSQVQSLPPGRKSNHRLCERREDGGIKR